MMTLREGHLLQCLIRDCNFEDSHTTTDMQAGGEGGREGGGREGGGRGREERVRGSGKRRGCVDVSKSVSSSLTLIDDVGNGL